MKYRSGKEVDFDELLIKGELGRAEITVVTGQADLSVVYSFSDPQNGKGVLKEECDGHTKLKQVSAKEPSPVYSVCGDKA